MKVSILVLSSVMSFSALASDPCSVNVNIADTAEVFKQLRHPHIQRYLENEVGNVAKGYKIVKQDGAFTLTISTYMSGLPDERRLPYGYKGVLTHSSGFSIDAGGISATNLANRPTESAVNIEIRDQMAQATTVAEYDSLKAKLNPALDVNIPTQDFVEALLENLPSCEAVLGGQK